MWTMTLFAGTFWVVGSLVIPETYAPVILRRRGQKLTKLTGKLHVSIYEQIGTYSDDNAKDPQSALQTLDAFNI